MRTKQHYKKESSARAREMVGAGIVTSVVMAVAIAVGITQPTLKRDFAKAVSPPEVVQGQEIPETVRSALNRAASGETVTLRCGPSSNGAVCEIVVPGLSPDNALHDTFDGSQGPVGP